MCFINSKIEVYVDLLLKLKFISQTYIKEYKFNIVQYDYYNVYEFIYLGKISKKLLYIFFYLKNGIFSHVNFFIDCITISIGFYVIEKQFFKL